MNGGVFQDRRHAGTLLADALQQYAGYPDQIVLALPRGGVPVAREVARRLHAPLDVMVVRKLGVPGHEEYAMGAVASGDIQLVNQATVEALGISEAAIEHAVAVQTQELQRRELAYRGHAGTPEVAGKTVILVDDGIATGSTVHAAVQALRQRAPKQIIIAVPVTSTDARDLLAPLVEDFVALGIPERFRAVGEWYEDFSQTTDEEVTQILAETAAPAGNEHGTSLSQQHAL